VQRLATSLQPVQQHAGFPVFIAQVGHIPVENAVPKLQGNIGKLQDTPRTIRCFSQGGAACDALVIPRPVFQSGCFTISVQDCIVGRASLPCSFHRWSGLSPADDPEP